MCYNPCCYSLLQVYLASWQGIQVAVKVLMTSRQTDIEHGLENPSLNSQGDNPAKSMVATLKEVGGEGLIVCARGCVCACTCAFCLEGSCWLH